MIRTIHSKLQLQYNRRSEFIRKYSNIHNYKVDENQKVKMTLDKRIEVLEKKLIYCDYIERRRLKGGYTKIKEIERHLKATTRREQEQHILKPFSIALKYLDSSISQDTLNDLHQMQNEEGGKPDKPIYMPYKVTDKFKTFKIEAKEDIPDEKELPVLNERYQQLYEKYLALKDVENVSEDDLTEMQNEIFDNHKTPDEKVEDNNVSNWMKDYEQFNDSKAGDSYDGTPNPNIEVSIIPCGGCGALLHCQDIAIPGYLPSELFVNVKLEDLRNTICQRCHFMKYYDTTLEVKVATDEYSQILSQLHLDKTDKAAVVLMIDLTDFPCSIWPNLSKIIGENTPIFLVGNKIDLLPQDCSQFFKNVENSLVNALIESGVATHNIQHVALISSKTGYGVERLITKLQSLWSYKGDVYVIGCTNVGKSTLFNSLLQSDYCKTQAFDLIQRATVSPWPGTTLNLLKFPILNPHQWRMFMRMKRRHAEKLTEHAEIAFRKRQFSSTRDIRFATLQEKVGKTFPVIEPKWQRQRVKIRQSKLKGKVGINPNDEFYKRGRWCYDTPGVIHHDQILNLLTTDELLLTLPKEIISPRTFIFKEGETLFLAGLGRLDLIDAANFIRITVFASKELPITICHTNDADDIYDQLLPTEVFTVPTNDPKRLEIWPKLQSKEFTFTGKGPLESATDVILSSAGWIALTACADAEIKVKAWTPEGRGIYMRQPALLAKSVTLRGARIRFSSAYRRGRQVYIKINN